MLSKDDVNYFELKIKSDIFNIKFIRNLCSIFLYNLDLTEGYLNEIKTVISEAITNSIVHGYEFIQNDILIQMSYTLSDVYIKITDYGKGIKDVKMARTPLYTTKPEDERSGLGFTIMEMFLDELIVDSIIDEGTTLFMRKKLI